MNALKFLLTTLDWLGGIAVDTALHVWGPVSSRARALDPHDIAHVLAVGCCAFASVFTVASSVLGDTAHLFAAAAAFLTMAGATFQKWASPPTPPENL